MVKFAVAANDQIADAMDRAVRFTDEREVITGEALSGESACFLDVDIAASLDDAFAVIRNVVINEADISAAFWALTGLSFSECLEAVIAGKAFSLTRRFDGKENSEPKGSILGA